MLDNIFNQKTKNSKLFSVVNVVFFLIADYLLALFTLHVIGAHLVACGSGVWVDFGSKLMWSGSFYNYCAAFIASLVGTIAVLIFAPLSGIFEVLEEVVKCAPLKFIFKACSKIASYMSTGIGIGWAWVWNWGLMKMAFVSLVGLVLGKLGWPAAATALSFGTIANVVVTAIYVALRLGFNKLKNKKEDKSEITLGV